MAHAAVFAVRLCCLRMLMAIHRCIAGMISYTTIVSLLLAITLLLIWQQPRRTCSCSSCRPYTTHALDQQQQQRRQEVVQPVPGSEGVSVVIGTASPAMGPVDLSLADMLLPLTNLSSLTTAALLDAHRPLSSSSARGLVRLYQDLYCR